MLKKLFLIVVIICVILASDIRLTNGTMAVAGPAAEKHSSAAPTLTRQCPAVHLPTVSHITYAPPCGLANNYCEDYDTYQHAYGPLAPGHTYMAYPDDMNDWYYIKLPEATAVTVEVSNYLAVGQLQIRDADLRLLAFAPSLPDGTMQISLEANQVREGVNFIWIHTTDGDNSQHLYSLKATYFVPPAPEYPPPLPDYYILDIFERENFDIENDWWTPDPHVFDFKLSTEQARWGTRSLKVEYAKSDMYQFIGKEIPASQRNISWAQTMDIWVYGAVALTLKLEEEDTLRQQEFGTLSATADEDWSLLQFDLRGATNVDMSRIKSIFLFVAPGDADAEGTFYLDEIVFKDQFGLLEDFQRFRYLNWWTPDPDAFKYSDRRWFLCQPMKIKFNKSDTYQFIGAEVPVGARDFSWAEVFEVWVYGDIDLLLVLEDEQYNKADIATLSASSSQGWSLLRYNYSSARNKVDLAHIRNLLLFPYPGNPAASGKIYIDNLALSDRP